MAFQHRQPASASRGGIPRTSIRTRTGLLAAAVLACIAGAAPTALRPAAAASPGSERPATVGFCTAAAEQEFAACLFAARDDLYNARATCINVSDPAERDACYSDAVAAQSEAAGLCGEQHVARKGLCAVLGEARYDPGFDPADFDSNFANPARTNPYQPLTIGNHWSYAGSGETIEVQILNQTKLIEGVTCIVANDRVRADGALVEDTDDWFAQARNGDVYYCGEETKSYESFAGDRPRLAELVAIDGAFKWGRDGAKGGLLVPATPHMGMSYRQELSIGDAEDAATVLATRYRLGKQPSLDRYVPHALVQRFCNAADCLVTAEATPLDPGAVEIKYYAVGVGLILEVTPQSREVIQLVGCNFDARCDNLPAP